MPRLASGRALLMNYLCVALCLDDALPWSTCRKASSGCPDGALKPVLVNTINQQLAFCTSMVLRWRVPHNVPLL